MLEGRSELLADFQQYYNLDLEKVLIAGEFERAKTLTLCLPLKSRTMTRLNPELVWDENAYLLSYIADNIAFQRYEQGGGKGKKPKPVERPKKEVKKQKKHLDVSARQIDSLLFAPR